MKNINIEEFVKVCENSLTMAEAAVKLNMHYNTFKRYAIKFDCWKPNRGGKGTKKNSANKNKIPLEEILQGLHPDYQTFKLKNRLIKEGIKENVCEICGISEWNGKPLNMELHHIDGDRTNHKLENLQIVCPNCHAQTDSFRAKNIKDNN